MQAEEVYRLLQPKPFQPVRVYLRSGQTYDIHMRELVIVGKTHLTIGIPAPGETEPIFDRLVRVELEDVTHLEQLADTPIVRTIEPQIGDEEIKRRLREGGGRELSAILADLKRIS